MNTSGEPTKKSILQIPLDGDVLRDIGIVARAQGKTMRQYIPELLAADIAKHIPPGGLAVPPNPQRKATK